MALQASIYSVAGQNLSIAFRYHESLVGTNIRVEAAEYLPDVEATAYPIGEAAGAGAGVTTHIHLANGALDASSRYLLSFKQVNATTGALLATLTLERSYLLKVGKNNNGAWPVLEDSRPTVFDDEETFTDFHAAIRRAINDGGSFNSETYTSFIAQLTWAL